MRKIFSIFSIMMLYVVMIYGQAAVEIPFTVEDSNGMTRNLVIGLDPTGTGGIDPLLGESELPPFPPNGIYESRFVSNTQAALGEGTLKDIRNAPAFPFSGTYIHQVKYQTSDPAPATITVSWNLPAEIVAGSVIRDLLGGTIINQPFVGTGSLVVNSPSVLNQLEIVVVYNNIGPIDPGPVFAVSPASLDFGNVGIGGAITETLTVSNSGSTNSMTITSASIANTDYIVAPNPPVTYPVIIAAGSSYNFDVTFTANNPGLSSGNVEFIHDAPGSPGFVPVTGNGQAQGGDLVFDPQTRIIFDNTNAYSTSLRLENYVGDDLKALQFRIVLDGLLLFRSIERGSAITSPEWNFSYEISEGSLNADGSRNDTIKVVLVGNGSNQLAPGNYEIAVIQYDAIDIEANQLTTTIHFENVIGATGTPNPGGDANIAAGPSQDITINNRVFYGDVNIDNRVDILDLLLMIDYILDRVTFSTEQFTRGDIAPWTSVQGAPSPDGEINAMDLALLQNIILTGQYPSGELAERPIQTLNISENVQKLNPGDDAALTFYITENGISIVLESTVKIKGLQLEFSSVANSTSGLNVQTVMGNGHYYHSQDILRVLVYDDQGSTIEPGEYLYLNMPFTLSNPKDIQIDNVILADENNERIEKFSIEVAYGDAPQLPTEYSLSQNYPNPFNPATSVQFTVPEPGDVSIVVYDMLGQSVRTLYTGNISRGTYEVRWDGLNEAGLTMSSGTYIYRMATGDFIQSKKMILLK